MDRITSQEISRLLREVGLEPYQERIGRTNVISHTEIPNNGSEQKRALIPEPKKVSWERGHPRAPTVAGCGDHCKDEFSYIVPAEVFFDAKCADESVGIDLLALGKQGGDIFNSNHWMYDGIRDHFYSILKTPSFKELVMGHIVGND